MLFSSVTFCNYKVCLKVCLFSLSGIRNEMAKIKKLIEEKRQKEKQIYSKLFS